MTGVFSCLVELQPGAADNVHDMRLRGDWFSYCTTTVPHAQILLLDDMLQCIVSCLHVSFEFTTSFIKLRFELRKLITRLKNGKRSEDARNKVIAQDEQLREKIQENWPQLVPTNTVH